MTTHSILQRGAARDEAFLAHPLIRDKQLFAVANVRMMYESVTAALVHRRPSCCWYGQSRHGKTRSLDAIEALLRQSHPNVPFVSIDAKYHEGNVNSERNLWGDMLLDWEHIGASSHNTGDRKANVQSYLTSLCDLMGSQQLVFAIDEAQNLRTAASWIFLKDLCNALKKRKPISIDPLIIIVGQPSLVEVIEEIKGIKDLRSRFFRAPKPFVGITSVEGVEDVLDCFDDPARDEYPANSGISYTEFFLPSAYEAKWRLASQSALLWEELSTARCQPCAQIGTVGLTIIRSTSSNGAASSTRVISLSRDLQSTGARKRKAL